MKQMELGALFTEQEIDRAVKIARKAGGAVETHATIREEIVDPVMARINEVTGQENDADYMTWVLRWAIMCHE